MDLLRRTRLALATLAVAALLFPAPAPAAPNEYALKAVFLYNFCRFIDWPGNAFASASDPIVIGILGDDPFGLLLEEAVQGEAIRGRAIRIEHYRNARDIVRCQLLFISAAEAKSTSDILAATAGRSIVTVGETRSFLERGGMIALIADGNRIRLMINPEPLRAARLEVSSKLLRVAEIFR